MEKKIDISELLKDCPKGMELDCTMFDNVTFVRVDNSRKQFPIEIAVSGIRSKYLTKEGCFHDTTLLPEAKCVIFPKGETTWEEFKRPFKDGDVVTDGAGYIGITLGGTKNQFIPTYCVVKPDGRFEAYLDKKDKWAFYRLANEEEKEKLFDAIKANGYQWNAKTKTLEKLIKPKFKVGDKIKNKYIHKYGCAVQYTIREVYSECYKTDCGILLFGHQDDYELLPNKFDISSFKPFDKVLIRNANRHVWTASFFSHIINSNKIMPITFVSVGGYPSNHCIPYDGNQHLLGTTYDCDNFYKTWED